MGRLALGALLRTFRGASVVFLWGSAGLAQAAAPGGKASPSGDVLPAQPPPPPAAQPAPAAPAPSAPAPSAPAPSAPRPEAAPPPPLDLPTEPPKRPAFLHTREEMEKIQGSRGDREASARAEPAVQSKAVQPDFVRRASPWIDFTLTSFYMDNRIGNFLNLGVQVGSYAFERLRVSARFVVPLEGVSDDLSNYSSGTQGTSAAYRHTDSRSMSMMYGVTAGLVITNSRSFVFGPSVELQRTDVEDYGSTLFFGLPFEWTTASNMRVGFEIALGHSFGGSVQERCETFTTPVTPCGTRTSDRPAGTAVLFQYYMGWSLGRL